MKIRPIFKTIDIFSFIQFLSRQTNYIIKFFLLKVLYLVWLMKQVKRRKNPSARKRYLQKSRESQRRMK